jgi:hypothetical protein
MSSLYFTPPLAAHEKRALYEAMGLGDLRYYYFEVLDGLILQGLRCERGQNVPLLEPADLDSLAAFVPAAPLPALVAKHPGQQLHIDPSNRPLDLFEELFPFPFSVVGARLNVPTGLSVKICSSEFAGRVAALLESFQRLEEFMTRQEVTFIWIKGNGPDELAPRFPLLFHYVRGRRIRVGTSGRLWELGRLYEEGHLTADGLRGIFGTHLEALCVNFQNMVGIIDPLHRLTQAIHQSLESHTAPPPSPRPLGDSPSPELRL